MLLSYGETIYPSEFPHWFRKHNVTMMGNFCLVGLNSLALAFGPHAQIEVCVGQPDIKIFYL